ncbi:MAG: hypothetical protein QW087_03625 [Methanomassiliicoccales archaeon]
MDGATYLEPICGESRKPFLIPGCHGPRLSNGYVACDPPLEVEHCSKDGQSVAPLTSGFTELLVKAVAGKTPGAP